MRPGPQVVLAHHTVEVHRRRDADEGGDRFNLRHTAQVVGKLAHHRLGRFERRAFGHVHNDLELVLVVVRQQFQRHETKQRHRRGAAKRDGDHPEKQPRTAAGGNERTQQRGVQAIRQRARDVVGFGGTRSAQQFPRHPRGDEERHNRARDHAERYVERHRRHVRPHHAGDEKQRRERDDHGDGRHDQRFANFRHRRDHRLARFAPADAEKPLDIVHPRDRIVDEQTERQDQGKQGDPVNRVSAEQIQPERNAVTHRHRESDDHGRAPAEKDTDEDHDREHGHAEAADEIVHFLIRGFAVIPDDAHVHPGREHVAFERGETFAYVARHPHRVRTFLFRDGDVHGGIRSALIDRAGGGRTERDPGVVVGFGRAVDDPGDVTEFHRHPVHHIDDHFAYVSGIGEKCTGFDRDRFVAFDDRARRYLAIRHLDGPGHVERRGLPRRECIRIEFDPDLARLSAANGYAIRRRDRLQFLFDLFAEAAQIVRVELLRVFAPQRGDDDGHVIDFVRFHHPGFNRRGYLIGVRKNLVVDLEQRLFPILTDVIAHGDDAAAVAGRRVDVFNTVDLVQQLFQRHRHLTLHLLRAQSGGAHDHIRDRDDNLRLFLARGEPQGRRATGQREQQDHHRQGAVHYPSDDAAGACVRVFRLRHGTDPSVVAWPRRVTRGMPPTASRRESLAGNGGSNSEQCDVICGAMASYAARKVYPSRPPRSAANAVGDRDVTEIAHPTISDHDTLERAPGRERAPRARPEPSPAPLVSLPSGRHAVMCARGGLPRRTAAARTAARCYGNPLMLPHARIREHTPCR